MRSSSIPTSAIVWCSARVTPTGSLSSRWRVGGGISRAWTVGSRSSSIRSSRASCRSTSAGRTPRTSTGASPCSRGSVCRRADREFSRTSTREATSATESLTARRAFVQSVRTQGFRGSRSDSSTFRRRAAGLCATLRATTSTLCGRLCVQPCSATGGCSATSASHHHSIVAAPGQGWGRRSRFKTHTKRTSVRVATRSRRTDVEERSDHEVGLEDEGVMRIATPWGIAFRRMAASSGWSTSRSKR